MLKETITAAAIVAGASAIAADPTPSPATQATTQLEKLPALGMPNGRFIVGMKGYIEKVKVKEVIGGNDVLVDYFMKPDPGTSVNQPLILRGWPTKELKAGDTFAVEANVKITKTETRGRLVDVVEPIQPTTRPATQPQSQPALKP